MILKNKLIVVTLEDETGSAKFTFAEPPLDRALEMQKILAKEVKTADEQKAFWTLILSDLKAIEGLFNEQEKPITVEQFKSLDVPASTVTSLLLARAAAMNEPEKKLSE